VGGGYIILREHLYALIRRVISAVVVVAILVQNAACVQLPAQPDKRACEEEKAEIVSRLKDDPKRGIFFNSETLDFEKNERRWSCAVFVQPGFYHVDVKVMWSDGSTERYLRSMGFRVEPGRQYSVRACEEGVGQAPAVPTLTDSTVPEGAPSWRGSGGAGGVVGLILLPVLVVVIVVVGLAKGVTFLVEKATEPSVRPNRYHWIEDVSTGEVVAGVRCPV